MFFCFYHSKMINCAEIQYSLRHPDPCSFRTPIQLTDVFSYIDITSIADSWHCLFRTRTDPKIGRKSSENDAEMGKKQQQKYEIDEKYFSVVPLSLQGGKMLAEVDFLDTFTKCLNHQGQSACLWLMSGLSSDVTPMYELLTSRDKLIRHHRGDTISELICVVLCARWDERMGTWTNNGT